MSLDMLNNTPTLAHMRDEISRLRARIAELEAAPTEEPARDLLRRIADANVIFPSMCANNVDVWNICEELKQYRSQPQVARS